MKLIYVNRLFVGLFCLIAVTLSFQNCAPFSTGQDAINSAMPANPATNQETVADVVTPAKIKFLNSEIKKDFVTSEDRATSAGSLNIQFLRGKIGSAETYTYDVRCTYSDSVLDNSEIKLFRNSQGEIKFSEGSDVVEFKLDLMPFDEWSQRSNPWVALRRVFVLKVFKGGQLVAHRTLKTSQDGSITNSGIKPGVSLNFEFNKVRFKTFKIDDQVPLATCELCFLVNFKSGVGTNGQDPYGDFSFLRYDFQRNEVVKPFSESQKIVITGLIEPEFIQEFLPPNTNSAFINYEFEGYGANDRSSFYYEYDDYIRNHQVLTKPFNVTSDGSFVVRLNLDGPAMPIYFINSIRVGVGKTQIINTVDNNPVTPFYSLAEEYISVRFPFSSSLPDPFNGNLIPKDWDMTLPILVPRPINKSTRVEIPLILENLGLFTTVECIGECVLFHKDKLLGNNNNRILRILSDREEFRISYEFSAVETNRAQLIFTSLDGRRSRREIQFQ